MGRAGSGATPPDPGTGGKLGREGSEGEISQNREPAWVSSLPGWSHKARWTSAGVGVERMVYTPAWLEHSQFNL